MIPKWEIKPINERRQPSYRALHRAAMPERYWRCQFNEIQPPAVQATLLDYAQNLGDNLKDGRGLLLYGPHGTGKTAAACLSALEAICRSANRTFFVLAAQIDWYARNRNDVDDDGVPYWKLICEAPFLVIDDIGAQRDVVWNDAWLEEVFRARYHATRPTIATSNYAVELLYERYRWMESLLRDSATVLEMAVPCR